MTENTAPENAPEPTLLEKATATADRIEKANAEMKELLERQERIRANDMLGGRSMAGAPAPQPPVESPKEYAARVMRGEFNKK